jgi:hypothetical protein
MATEEVQKVLVEIISIEQANITFPSALLSEQE